MAENWSGSDHGISSSSIYLKWNVSALGKSSGYSRMSGLMTRGQRAHLLSQHLNT